MPSLLLTTLRVDATHWATGFTHGWLRGLARHLDTLDVLALETGDTTGLPDNVRVFGFRRATRAATLATFYRYALRLLPRTDGVLCHLIPRYAALIAPPARALGKPVTLWYTHREAGRDLRLALPLVNRVPTAAPHSFPLSTRKLHVMGHGIDTDLYAPTGRAPQSPPLVVHVARLAAIKGQSTLIAALAQVPDAHAAFIGAAVDDDGYLATLHHRTMHHDLETRVTFTGGLAAADVRGWYARASAAVNLSPVGLFDKAALESMACAVPTLVTNPDFAPLLPDPLLLLPHHDAPSALAERLRWLFALPAAERAAIGQEQRARVVAQHGLDGLMERLATLALKA